jgi:outer membrane protein assembly factor BamA
VRPSLSRELTGHWSVSAFLLAKAVNTYDILIEPESLAGEPRYSAASIGISQTIDFRNDPVLPTSGFIATTSLDFAPDDVSEISFVRGVAQAAYYLPVTSQSTLALGARGGIISPLGSEVLPIDERFFNGGATTVRSYPELKLGPRDQAGYPLGGETFTVFNVEYIFPIWRELKGAVFFDAGNVISKAEDFGLRGMEYALGAGLRYNLPIGPIRLDYGYNPDKQTGEPQGAFHFSIGLAF